MHDGKVYIFYHIFCNNNTADIVRDQCLRILFSNLYNRVDNIYCFLAGDPSTIDTIATLIRQLGQKFTIAEKGPNDTSYERFTLLKIPQYIRPADKFLYIHSKGVSYSMEPTEQNIFWWRKQNVFWWRTWMEHFLVNKYEQCLTKLDDYDIVGINYTSESIGPHFSGNFWWATGKYYLTLGDIPTTGIYAYNEPERYIFSGKNVKYLDIDEGRVKKGVSLYMTPFYPSYYVGKNPTGTFPSVGDSSSKQTTISGLGVA